MDIGSLSSPSLTHCGPNLFRHMSLSVVYPSLESVPTRRGCILWLCGRMGLLREGSIFKGCSCEEALTKPGIPAEQTGQTLAAKRVNHWAEMSLNFAEMANGSISHPSWELGMFSLSIPVKSMVKHWQGTATNQSWVSGEGMLNTPCNAACPSEHVSIHLAGN